MQAWLDFLNAQEKQLGKEVVDKWLRSLKVVHFDSGNLYLEAHDSFHLLWFEEHVRLLLQKGFVNNNHRKVKVHITCREENTLLSEQRTREKIPSSLFTLSQDPLDPTHTLEQFVSGKSNILLLQFLKELVESKIDLGSFNPLVLYGDSGTGKTHLLMALSQGFSTRSIKSLYVRAETFTEHVVSAIRRSEMQKFREHYRNVDVLLFDDIPTLARRAATQEEFFHTFNALHMAGKQLILSSHLPPSLLEEIEPRLISRFEWGIQFSLEKLHKEELKEVLIKKSTHLQCPLAPETITFILDTFPPNLLSINRALDALILHAHLLGKSFEQPISRSLAEQLLKDLIAAESKQVLTPDKIISAAAAYFGIKTEDILGKSHAQDFTLARQIAMHFCRMQLHLPFTKIGSIFSRDHSTVMASVKQVQQGLEKFDGNITTAIIEIKKKLT